MIPMITILAAHRQVSWKSDGFWSLLEGLAKVSGPTRFIARGCSFDMASIGVSSTSSPFSVVSTDPTCPATAVAGAPPRRFANAAA